MEQYITNSDIHDINTRHGSNIHQTISNLLYIKAVLILWDSSFFNNLPTYMKDISCNVKEFKRLLTNFLYSNYFYMLEEYFQYNNTKYILFIAYILLYYLIKQY